MFARLCSIGFLSSSLTQAAILPAAADVATASVPDVATLRAKVAAAEGTRPDRERITETSTAGGMTRKTVVLRAGKDVRADEVAGPFSTASGSFGGQRWRQNANGETILVQPEAGRASGEAETTTVTRVTTPADAYVIAQLNARGQGTKEYVDAATYRLIRHDDITPTGVRVTTYDDFRKTAGFVRAWHWTTRDGYADNDAEHRIVGIEEGVAGDVRVPANRRILVEFPAGKNTVDLPAREYNGEFIVRVQMGSRGYDFTLDTGAAGIVINDDVVRDLQLKTYGTVSNARNAGLIRESSAIVPEMSVGELKLRDVVVRTIPPLDFGDNKVFKTVGLLGFDFIGDVALSLDYLKGTVSATSPEAFAPPKDPRTFAIPVRLGDEQPLTDVSVNNVLGERFGIDTGWDSNMGIFDYFARRHPEAMQGAVFLENQPRFMGVGGEIKMTPYRFASVKLGNIQFKDFIAERVASIKQYAGDDGVIGAGFLQHFTVYTDYVHSTFYFVPNGRRDV